MRLHLTVAALLILGGCAAPLALPDVIDAVDAVDALLLGEQHDAAGHPRLQQGWVAALAQRGALAAVALEMAEQGASTAGLARAASEAEVKAALRWNQQAWPWERYGLPVMAAVRSGVPVLGANLPREQLRAAMQDAVFDGLLPGPALKAQQQAIRRGHCEMLPEPQIRPLTRAQIARDQAMARTISSQLARGKVVVLIAGAGHVQPDLGVPLHLAATVRVRPLVLPAETTGKDYCEEFRQQRMPG
jgi:uncharacterized iron-regulated protein